MNKSDIDEVARALTALKAWKRVSKSNWAFVSKMFDHPLVVAVDDDVRDPAVGRILFFNGFDAFRDFRIFQAERNISYAMSPADIDHFEIIGLKDGSVEMLDFRPGFAPRRLDAEMRQLLAPVVYECYGVLMRMEDEPDLANMYSDENALFSRDEGLDGKWRDAPLKLPAGGAFSVTERVALDKAKCAKASRFVLATDEVWETDFISIPSLRTEENPSRIMHLFAAVNVRTGERRVWRKLAVDPSCPRDGTLNAMKPLWESLASLLLDGVLEFGKVPGAVHVNSGRMARFLRPLGLRLPFKLVHHRVLPRFAATVNCAITERTI